MGLPPRKRRSRLGSYVGRWRSLGQQGRGWEDAEFAGIPGTVGRPLPCLCARPAARLRPAATKPRLAWERDRTFVAKTRFWRQKSLLWRLAPRAVGRTRRALGIASRRASARFCRELCRRQTAGDINSSPIAPLRTPIGRGDRHGRHEGMIRSSFQRSEGRSGLADGRSSASRHGLRYGEFMYI